MQHGIQIHDSGNHFQTAIHLKGKGPPTSMCPATTRWA
jgi:hypothetical protein